MVKKSALELILVFYGEKVEVCQKKLGYMRIKNL